MADGIEAADEALRASGHYGPRVDVPADSDEQTWLLAFLGRRPDAAELASEHESYRLTSTPERGEGQRRASSRSSCAKPMGPRSSAARWNSLRSNDAPPRSRAASRAPSHTRSPTLYEIAWPGKPR